MRKWLPWCERDSGGRGWVVALFLLGCLPAMVADIIPFAENDTLEEVRAKIAHNGYNFTVNTNRFSKMTP